MKRLSVITSLNLYVSIPAWCLFLLNQLCNLRFFGLWTVWNLSGYLYALLVGPISAIASLIFTVIFIVTFKSHETPKQKAEIFINIICAVITVFLAVSCFAIKGALTWA